MPQILTTLSLPSCTGVMGGRDGLELTTERTLRRCRVQPAGSDGNWAQFDRREADDGSSVKWRVRRGLGWPGRAQQLMALNADHGRCTTLTPSGF